MIAKRMRGHVLYYKYRKVDQLKNPLQNCYKTIITVNNVVYKYKRVQRHSLQKNVYC